MVSRPKEETQKVMTDLLHEARTNMQQGDDVHAMRSSEAPLKATSFWQICGEAVLEAAFDAHRQHHGKSQAP
jgi:hypothetical protein